MIRPSRFASHRLAAIIAIALAGTAAAQESDTGVALGDALYRARCASCHGYDARGDGPAAGTLATRPADLTQITKRAGGTFPAARVVEIITYGGNIAAHGGGPMPVWGKVFSDEGGGGKIGAAHSRQSLIALKKYLETIQQ